MRAVLQRVSRASVTVAGEVVGAVGKGICVLVGIHANDTQKDVDYIVKKMLALRVFPDDDGKPWARSVTDIGGGVLLVSQFTLYAVTSKGAKPDFHNAMKNTESEAMFQNVVDGVRSQYDPLKVAEGRFGAMMDVEIHNDGPVTIILESPSKEEPAGPAAKAKKEHEAAKAARREQFAGKSSKPDVVDPRAAADADK